MRKIIFFLIMMLLVIPFVSAGFVDWMKNVFGDSYVTGYVAADGNICSVSESIERKLIIVEDNLDSLIDAVESAKVVPAENQEVKKDDVEVSCSPECNEISVCVEGRCKIREGESCLRKTDADCATGFCSPTGFCDQRFEPEKRVVPPVADLVMNIEPDQDLSAGLTCVSSEHSFITKAIFVHEPYSLIETPNDAKGKLYLVGELDLEAAASSNRFVDLGNFEANGIWSFNQLTKPENIQYKWLYKLSTGRIKFGNEEVLSPTLHLVRRHTSDSDKYEDYFSTAIRFMDACKLCNNIEGENDCFKDTKYTPEDRDSDRNNYPKGIVCKGSGTRPFNLAVFLFGNDINLISPNKGSKGKLYLINNEGIEFEKKDDAWKPTNLNLKKAGFYLKTNGMRFADYSIPGPSLNFLRNNNGVHEIYLLSSKGGNGAVCKTCDGRLTDNYCFNEGVAY